MWVWSGSGGLKQSLIADLITFGALKGAGHLSRESNLIFQHSFTSTAMVAGHQTAGLFGLISRPEESLAEQFLHAEVMNLQLGAGMGLVHRLAPSLVVFEKGLNLSLNLRQGVWPIFPWGPRRISVTSLPEGLVATFIRPPIFLSSSKGEGKDGPTLENKVVELDSNIEALAESARTDTPDAPRHIEALVKLVRAGNPQALMALGQAALENPYAVITLKGLNNAQISGAGELLRSLDPRHLLRKAIERKDKLAQLAIGYLGKAGNLQITSSLEEIWVVKPEWIDWVFEAYEKGDEAGYQLVTAMETRFLAHILSNSPHSKAKTILQRRAASGDLAAAEVLLGKPARKKNSIPDFESLVTRWYRHRPMDHIQLLSDYFFYQHGVPVSNSPLLLTRLLEIAREEIYWPGETIVKEGERSQGVFLIIQGSVNVHDRAGTVNRNLKKGNLLGERGFLLDIPYQASGSARNGLTVLRFPRDLLKALLPQYPAIQKVLENADSLNGSKTLSP